MQFHVPFLDKYIPNKTREVENEFFFKKMFLMRYLLNDAIVLHEYTPNSMVMLYKGGPTFDASNNYLLDHTLFPKFLKTRIAW